MANLYLCPDDFWRCPIDLNHQVLAKRFPYHIRRCMIANPHIRRVRCVFNANHLTSPKDLLAHMSTCPDAIDRSTVLMGLSDFPFGQAWADTCKRSSEPTNWQMCHDVNATEDWDDDIRERRAKSAMTSTTDQSNYLLTPRLTPVMHSSYDKHHDGIFPTSPVMNKKKIDQSDANKLVKQAHVFEQYENDGRIHPVEIEDVTKNLLKIRTLQLLGGAGRGTCCLLRPSLQ